MINGLLNGKSELTLPNGDVLRAAGVHDAEQRDVAGFSLECVRNGKTRWRTPVKGLGVDPASTKNSSATCDFRILYWDLNDSIALAGRSKILLVSADDGGLKFEGRPRFIDVGGLDKLEIMSSASGALLTFVSTKRIVSLTDDFRKVCELELRGLVGAVELGDEDTLRVLEYDVADAKMPLREKLLNLRTCQYIESGGSFAAA
jgi:hypothetical protein